MNQFPQNPANGTIFELQPGIFYIYDTSLRSWNRIEGLVVPPVASPTNDGLMPASDLQKLNRLVIPPPQSTITTELCSGTFTGGIIKLASNDKYVVVEGEAPLRNNSNDYVTQPVNFQVHQHTYFFDFTIDQTALYEYMVSKDQFVVRSKTGRKGPPGDKGADGIDAQPFGPDGPRGAAGANAPISFSLTDESISYEVKKKYKRGLVDITVEPADNNSYYLVANRANVGNPIACPNTVAINSLTNSPWLLAVRDISQDASFVNFNFSGNANLPGQCLTCNTELFYIDISSIIDNITAEYNLEIDRMVQGFESVVTFWLNIMAGLFDEQKAALCCALEFCKSQSRNNDTRQYIEAQRIQAAIAGSSIALDGDPTNKNVTIMDPACEPDGFGADTVNGIPNNADALGGPQCIPGLIIINDPNRRVIQFPQCPPGFVPIAEARLRYGNTNPGDGSILIQSADPRYRQLFNEVRGDTTTMLARNHSSAPTNVVFNLTVNSNDFMHYDFWYVTDIGKTPEHGSLGNMALTATKSINGGKILQFTDSLVPGDYYLYFNNRSSKILSIALQIVSQNAIFVKGSGRLWRDSYLSNSYTDESDNKFPAGTVIADTSGPEDGNGWWLQLRVLPAASIVAPYSGKCGAIGPASTVTDGRLCKEIPTGLRNPLGRENELDVSYRGAMRDWVTTKCGDFLVPDAIELSFESSKINLSENIVLCRTNLGNYTGGFNTDKYSVQVIVEQQNALEVKPQSSKLYPKTIIDSYNDASKLGGNKYRTTILLWEGPDCSGNELAFTSDMVAAQCHPWGARGIWHVPDFDTIKYELRALENDGKTVDLAVAVTNETLLYLNARKNSKNRNRRTTITLPAGHYTVDIVNCCLQSGQQFTGHIEIEYNTDNSRKIKRFPNLGSFPDNQIAKNAYVGLTIDIDHSGGEIAASLVTHVTQLATGEVVVRFTNSQIKQQEIVSGDNTRKQFDGCRVQVGQIKWLEDIWRQGACDGIHVTVGGQDYIIIKASSKMTTQCTSKYKSDGLSYAWPTFDGVEFVGVPDSGSVLFKHDQELQITVNNSIRENKVISSKGNANKILLTLFPTAL